MYLATQFHYDHIFTTKMTAVENGCSKWKFFFFWFFFSQLWRTLARKLMKRPAVFITYFQIANPIVHVYQILRSGYFFHKFVGRFNLMFTFFAFHHFCEKTYEKTYQFYGLFSNILLLCACSQSFVIWKKIFKKWRLFQNVNNSLFMCSTLSNICDKIYEKTYHFFFIFWNFHFVFTTLQNFMISKLIKRKCCLLEYVNKILLIPVTLNNVFDNNCKTYFKVCNVFFKFVSIFTLSRSFVMTTFLQQKLQLFQCC